MQHCYPHGKAAFEPGDVSALDATTRLPAIAPGGTVRTPGCNAVGVRACGITHWGRMPTLVRHQICWGAEATLCLGSPSADGECISQGLFSLLYLKCLRTRHSPGAPLYSTPPSLPPASATTERPLGAVTRVPEHRTSCTPDRFTHSHASLRRMRCAA